MQRAIFVARYLRPRPSTLVAAGLLDRRDNPDDRRHLLLTLTDAGREPAHGVLHRRRPAIGQILHRMLPHDRAQPTDVLSRFAADGAEPEDGIRGRSAGTTESPGGAAGPGPVHGRPRREQAG